MKQTYENVKGNKATVDAFTQNLSNGKSVPFAATYATSGASPATVVYAVNPSAGELAFHLTQTGGSASNVQFIVNSSGNYSCTQSGSSWSCNKLDQASATDQENLFDLYTPDHWINFLKGLSLVAGLAGDKVTTSTMSVNGFDHELRRPRGARGGWNQHHLHDAAEHPRVRQGGPGLDHLQDHELLGLAGCLALPAPPWSDGHNDDDVSRVRVGLEVGKTWVFASALDWPGWCRRGKGEEAALNTLAAYADRYRQVAGPDLVSGLFDVVGAVQGNATTDFGAPGIRTEWDEEPIGPEEAARQTALLRRAWEALDRAARGAPEILAKGPRGGGRDRDGIVSHAREAERSYARRIGVRVPPRTAWPAQREAIVEALRNEEQPTTWPRRYFLRRAAWHVLDHAWELEDKTAA